MQKREKQKLIDDKVFETLHCLDKVDKVKANPFLYTRIKQKLDAPKTSKTGFQLSRFFRPILLPTLVVASALLGILIGNNNSSNIQSSRSQNIKSFASFYGFKTQDLNNYLLIESE